MTAISAARASLSARPAVAAQRSAISAVAAQASIDLCDDGRLVLFEEATHWVQHEEADQVNELIDTFLRGDANS